MNFYYVFVILHLLGLAIGAGAAYSTDIHVLFTVKKGRITEDAYAFFHRAGLMVFGGLGLSLLSGLGLFLQAPDFYLSSTPFLLKMTLVGIILVNGILIHVIALPIMKSFIGKGLFDDSTFLRKLPVMTALSSVSAVSWLAVIILGANLAVKAPLGVMVLMYFCAIVAVYLSSYAGFLLMKRR